MRKILIPILCGLLLFFMATYVSGKYDLYDRFFGIDKVYHMIGGAIVAWFFAFIFKSEVSSLPLYKRVLLLVGCAALVGVLWEFAERLSSIYAIHAWPKFYHFFHGGDLDDTLGDLLADIVGAFIFALSSCVLKLKR